MLLIYLLEVVIFYVVRNQTFDLTSYLIFIICISSYTAYHLNYFFILEQIKKDYYKAIVNANEQKTSKPSNLKSEKKLVGKQLLARREQSIFLICKSILLFL